MVLHRVHHQLLHGRRLPRLLALVLHALLHHVSIGRDALTFKLCAALDSNEGCDQPDEGKVLCEARHRCRERQRGGGRGRWRRGLRGFSEGCGYWRCCCHRPSSASLRSAGAYEKNDSDSDCERHFRHWLREQGQWLSDDAYSLACMVIGMNHLLQALTYNVVATVWEMSQLTGIICVVLAKVLSFQLLRIDMGDNVLTTQDCRLGYSLEILPPVLSVFLLAIFPPNQEVDEGSYGWMSVLAVPVFLLHGGWLLFVRAQMQEGAVAKVSSLAKRNPSQYDFQTAGVAEYLDDSEDNDEGIRADFAAASDNGSNRVNDERRRVGSLRARPTFSTTAVHDDMDFLPGTFQTVKYLKVIRLEKSSPERLPAQAFDHKPAKVVQSFSLAVASCWFLAGALHVINAFWCPLGSSDSMIPQSPDSNLDHAVPLLNKAHQHPGNAGRAHSTSTSRSSTRVHPFMRRLSVSWPEPSALFMIDAILCSEPRLLFGTEFATYGAERLANDSLSPVLELAESRLSSMFCSAFGCSVLISPTDRDTTWKLAPIDVYAQPSPSLSLSDATVVPVPASWRLVDGAWDSCTQAHCNDAWLAGWDGVRVVVATLRRENSASAWELHQRFKVRPGVGGCYAGPSVCDNWRLGSYDSVKALRLGGGGRTLAILHGDGILDGWSLRTGALLGRWALGSEYTAMCHDGTSLLVTRQCAAGPILESAPLPPALREELRGVQSRVDRVPANVVPLSPLGMANLRR
eukprot:TRINITY_DN29274_c0_g2_i1.p1 TRINITY_DN29274_c0_g2~~TRINITY_DN29274_c0_g2_i1.p1  ORF type:complete len:743 (+),score=59.62 TRINITY_DN29274_c0_g2_i1:413-2641(+)